MRKVNLKFYNSLYLRSFSRFVSFTVGVFCFLSFSSVALAQEISADDVMVSSTFGKLEKLADILNFVANLMKYVGWAGVIIGVIMVIALLIYKLIGSDDAETMKKVQGGITKAVIIVILGILLLSAGFILNVIQQLVGLDNEYTFTVSEGLESHGP